LAGGILLTSAAGVERRSTDDMYEVGEFGGEYIGTNAVYSIFDSCQLL
jgi:hypothetical protein